MSHVQVSLKRVEDDGSEAEFRQSMSAESNCHALLEAVFAGMLAMGYAESSIAGAMKEFGEQ